MSTNTPAEPAAVPTAASQAPIPTEQIVHSANCGLIIHRVGQLEYEFAAEGRQFGHDLLAYLNTAQAGVFTTFLYEEVLGTRDRLHWYIHLKSPHDYQRVLHMVDHDRDFQDISENDRLEEKGGGNWERMFVQGSIQERIICPQHGKTHPDDGFDPQVMFLPPARHQTEQPVEAQLNTATSGALLHRTAEVRYDVRDPARDFAVAWQERLNLALPGVVTSFFYEETFGKQDRIHWLIHLRSLADYPALREAAAGPGAEELLRREWVPKSRGGGSWGGMFIPGTIQDTVLVPYVGGVTPRLPL
ncbi:DUF6039 family protein [Micromonospora sp. DT233]|uniref:DUF6039 family protein n=1 Tax=Micromonospora sp. DT233 TaxID=3393432 RepID=UPI003CEFD723